MINGNNLLKILSKKWYTLFLPFCHTKAVKVLFISNIIYSIHPKSVYHLYTMFSLGVCYTNS